MRKSFITICFFLFLLLLVRTSDAQSPYESSCGSTLFQTSQLPMNPQDGFFKPNRTDTINGNPIISSSYFPVLIVFVQFLDDANDNIWPNTCDTSGPIYRDSLIAFNKNYNSSWWNAYDQNKETFSNYFIQLSLGRFHLLGKAYSVRLDSNASYYRTAGMTVLNEHIWNKLNQRYPIDWAWYDKWSWNGTNFEYGSDNNVDFIYKVHKTTGGVLPEYDGYSSLDGSDFKVDTLRWIRSGYGYSSSGITCARNLLKKNVMGVCVHEQGHYTFSGGHLIYGRNSYAIGVEAFYSPYEMILSGYMTPRTATFGQTNSLGDYSSRNNVNGEVIKVPISETEFFLLANRGKVCYWDRLMLGDTAFYDPYNISDYGKGLYIYHVFDGIYRPTADWCSPHDMECADGYYRWEASGWASVDMNCWTSGNVWKTYNKAEVLYENDPSLHGTHLLNTLKGDGLSLHDFFSYTANGSPNGYTIKHSYGDPPIDNCHLGTDRVFTNNRELYSTYNNNGDRYDAWKPVYNEIFSPYSSPSTKKKNNEESGVFIWYYNTNGNSANIAIFRASEFGGNQSLAEILEITPPSRPMGLKHEFYYPQNSWCIPKITWNHNMEPDMERISEKDTVKRYLVYRVTAPNMSTVPNENAYVQIAQVDIPIGETPHYEDYTVLEHECAELDQQPPYGTEYPVRYRVIAVDNTDWASVMSDFVSTTGITEDGGDPIGGGEDSHEYNNSNTPKDFNLSQNYPNPFNPTTKINFALPKQGFVTLKIYDITGREVKTLVNEFKQSGYYSIDFNGSYLASGVYFYRIQSNDFVMTKRMVLIK
ncbi:MAG: T9SS type A sorting domain-containing protein [Ignavibacteriae bacterium]|nr:T9SS type A sorting domain-containing protein [Ignavibacteriota bacterium]